MTGETAFSKDVAVIGGGGHIGLPLALTFADSGLKTVIYDSNKSRVAEIRSGVMPFIEDGGQELLTRTLGSGRLEVHDRPEVIALCRHLIMVIGTPVDEHLNPMFMAVHRAVTDCLDHLRSGQIFILRSTVFPGVTESLQGYFDRLGLEISVACCPERVAQGHSLEEFRTLPQIIGCRDRATAEAVKSLFGRFTPEFIEMAPREAELCKLMTNAWRYLQFAIVNQFYMIATEHGLDFERILHGCRHKYPRMAGLPGPGLAAGPCLVKDTMQLAAFSQNTFHLGHAGMLINEGLPHHLIHLAKRRVDLRNKTAGILGMAFKAESDDNRDSLSYKIKKLLFLEAKKVLCTDPYVQDKDLTPLEQVLAEAEVLFVAAPHNIYRDLEIGPDKVVIDVWGAIKSGPRPEKVRK